jgi:sugar lactone lactonase YvrE
LIPAFALAGILLIPAMAAAQTNFGSVAVGSNTSAAVTMTFESSATLGSIAVVTQGAPNLDFTDAGGGTCTVGTAYATGATCTVNASFTPIAPGLRRGGAVLYDNAGNVLATTMAYGVGTGPQATFQPCKRKTVGSGLANGQGLAVDAAGNIFVADYGVNGGANGDVVEFVAAGGYTTTRVLAGSFYIPIGVAVDGVGNVFVADSGEFEVKELLAVNGSVPPSGVIRSFRNGTAFASPEGVAVDGSGNVFVADSESNGIFEMLASGGYSTILQLHPGGGFAGPNAIAIDSSGNLFTTIAGNVLEVPAAGGYTKVRTMGRTFTEALGVAVDAAANVYIGYEYNPSASVPVRDEEDAGKVSGGHGGRGIKSDLQTLPMIEEIPVATGYQTVKVLTLTASPGGVATDGSGNVYYTENGVSGVAMLTCSEPPSLSFKTATDVGSIDTADGPQTTSLWNTGNGPFLFGSYPADFPANTDDSLACEPDATIGKGLGCDISVNFMPSLRNRNTADLFVTATQSIALSGTGIGTQSITFGPIAPQIVGTTLNLKARASSALAVSFATLSPTVCTVAGTAASLIAAGPCTILATQAGGDLYQAAPPVDQTFNVRPLAQTVTFTPIPSGQVAATTVNLSATASTGLPVSFGSLTPAVCTVEGAQASLIAYGFCTVQASQAGSSEYGATSVSQTFGVAHASQTLTFAPISSPQVAGTTLNLQGTATSGLPVIFVSTTPTICTITGATTSLIASGFCGIEATQPGNNASGNSEYFPAPPIRQQFGVAHGTQTIDFAAIPAGQVAGTNLLLTATASSGLPVSFASLSPSVCTVSGIVASPISYGTCTIEASQPGTNAAGNSEYFAATAVETFGVGHGTQAIFFISNGSKVAGQTLFLEAAATSGLPVTLTSNTPAVCTLSGTIATLLTYGHCDIVASVAGNNEYFALSTIETIAVSHATQSITFPAIAGQVVGTPLNVAATASSGLAVSFASTTPAVCSVAGATVSFIAAGTCTIEASQAGNDVYFAAPAVGQSFAVTAP